MYPTATAPMVLNERVPDPAVQVLDPSFEKYRLLLASVERLSQGYSWAEGPVYFADTRCSSIGWPIVIPRNSLAGSVNASPWPARWR